MMPCALFMLCALHMSLLGYRLKINDCFPMIKMTKLINADNRAYVSIWAT